MKTKLTKEIIEDVTKKLKVGCYAKEVAASIGIVEKTYYNWLERGSRAEKLADSNKKVPKEEKIFLQFIQSIRQSEAELHVMMTSMVFSKAPSDWRAAMTLMARKWPEQWGRKDYIGLGGHIDQGPDKRQEALNEFEEMFKDVPRAKLASIIQDTNKRLNEAKNEFLMKKETKNKQLQAPD